MNVMEEVQFFLQPEEVIYTLPYSAIAATLYGCRFLGCCNFLCKVVSELLANALQTFKKTGIYSG